MHPGSGVGLGAHSPPWQGRQVLGRVVPAVCHCRGPSGSTPSSSVRVKEQSSVRHGYCQGFRAEMAHLVSISRLQWSFTAVASVKMSDFCTQRSTLCPLVDAPNRGLAAGWPLRRGVGGNRLSLKVVQPRGFGEWARSQVASPSDGSYDSAMKAALVVLLMLVQLRPVLGSAVCLHAAAHPQQECQMPDHRTPGDRVLTESGQAPDCTTGQACAPSTLSLPQLVQSLDLAVPADRAPAAVLSSLHPGDAVGPPLPPPIV